MQSFLNVEQNAKTGTITKEYDKIKTKSIKATTAVETADQAYLESVQQLEEARIAWEHDTVGGWVCVNVLCMCVVAQTIFLATHGDLICVKESGMRSFQEFEEERIDFTRKLMWLHTNVFSLTYVHNDQVCLCHLSQRQPDDDDFKQKCEFTRQALEKVSVEKDIHEFILCNRTGSERPRMSPLQSYKRHTLQSQ
jgi:hypothetical protein